jgi:protein phosphatase 2C family protein 2/3
MGGVLSEPVLEKISETDENDRLKFGFSCMQGYRMSMEDAHRAFLSLPRDNANSYFGVFDGHGGAEVAKYCAEHLHERISNDPAYRLGDHFTAIKNGFLRVDEEVRDQLNKPTEGTTSLIALIDDKRILVGNAGDSRSVLSRGGKAVPMSYDHKPHLQQERQRIISAGGSVDFNRVNGQLAVSRAIGDFSFKRNTAKALADQMVSAEPDTKLEQLNGQDEFLIMACDGIWDVMSNEDAVKFVRKKLKETDEVSKICENLIDKCLELGSKDNMSVIIIVFKHFLEQARNNSDSLRSASMTSLQSSTTPTNHDDLKQNSPTQNKTTSTTDQTAQVNPAPTNEDDNEHKQDVIE